MGVHPEYDGQPYELSQPLLARLQIRAESTRAREEILEGILLHKNVFLQFLRYAVSGKHQLPSGASRRQQPGVAAVRLVRQPPQAVLVSVLRVRFFASSFWLALD